MRTGNVIKSPSGDLWIVIDVNERVVQALAFDAENVSAVQRLDDHERTDTCQCGDHPDFMGEPQEDCDRCHGTGSYVVKVVGWGRSKVLASSVKHYIEKRWRRAMGIT